MSVKRKKENILSNYVNCQLVELSTGTFWKAVIAEFLGTLMLCTWTIGSGLRREEETADLLDVALTAGFFIGMIITVLQAVSGGHVNPAISTGLLVSRKISLARFAFYVPAQILGGILAVFLIQGLFPADMWGTLGYLSPGNGVTDAQAFGCEFCIAFLLLFGTVAMIDAERDDIRGSVPLFIGLIVVVNILFVGRVSGGCMNPVRNFGPAVVTGNLQKQWIYWAGNLLGGATGAILYDRLFSVAAMSKHLIGCCCKSRDSQALPAQDGLDASEMTEMLDSKPLSDGILRK